VALVLATISEERVQFPHSRKVARMTKDRAVIFDLDGTIIDTERAWDDAAKTLLGKRGIPYERERTKNFMMGRSLREGAAILKETYGLTESIDELTEERRALAKDFFVQEVSYVAGALKFIQETKKKYLVAIATSMTREFFAFVDANLHLSELFDGHIYSVEDIGNISKPNPDIFLFAARKLDIAPEFCVVIEDAPYGIQAAKSAGMKSVGITTSTTRDKLSLADHVVDSFSEIQLEKLYA